MTYYLAVCRSIYDLTIITNEIWIKQHGRNLLNGFRIIILLFYQREAERCRKFYMEKNRVRVGTRNT